MYSIVVEEHHYHWSTQLHPSVKKKTFPAELVQRFKATCGKARKCGTSFALPGKTVCNMQGATVNEHYMESGWIKRADLHRGCHQVVSRQNSPDFHHLFGWQLLKFTSKICTPWTKNWGFLDWIPHNFHILINQPNQPNQQIIGFLGAAYVPLPTFIAFIASDNREAFDPWISISWWSSTWTAACIATAPAHPCVSSIACSARLWVTPPTSKDDYIYREWLENHKGSFTGWFETDFNEPFSGWLWLIWNLSFQGHVQTQDLHHLLSGWKRLRVTISCALTATLLWKYPATSQVCEATKSADKKSHCTTMVPEYMCFSRDTHHTPIQKYPGLRGTNLTMWHIPPKREFRRKLSIDQVTGRASAANPTAFPWGAMQLIIFWLWTLGAQKVIRFFFQWLSYDLWPCSSE